MISRTSPRTEASEREPLWYKNAIIYELHVRAFSDSNGDGIGDFHGLTQKLDYLHDLGVTAIWLLPFYPSPLKDDGYDIADYTGVNPAYGTLRDFRRLVASAHQRDLRIITELVLNHTSDSHPWFQRARRAPAGTPARDFYVWSSTPDKYAEARIIFGDFETSNWTWDPVANAYYWHRFYSHQPDLNFDNPQVHDALLQVVDTWFEMGVDGVRLDAVPYLYEREHTSCENLPPTHDFLRKLRAHVDSRFHDRMLLAEANQWPEDAAAYFGNGDECHMAFHFPVMPRLFMAIRMEDRFPIIDILQQTPSIPGPCQWALFLRNHDELTLEMVTDEERDYMYRVFADDRQARINLGIRRRLAPLMGNNRRTIELMNGLLFSLPGTPVIYYGDELGMGDNIYLHDRDAVRTPMQWSPDRNAGFSRCNPQKLYLPVIIDPEYSFEAVNVESQQNNPHSLLWWMKRLIALRRKHSVFGRGEIDFLTPDNPKVLAFVRRDVHERILVVANLSRFVQATELRMPELKGYRPIELFGGTPLPIIQDSPYFLTLGPHAFYWFALSPQKVGADLLEPRPEPVSISFRGSWESAFEHPRVRKQLEPVLAHDIVERRWFSSKSRSIRALHIVESAEFPTNEPTESLLAFIVLVDVQFTEGEAETYAIPLALSASEHIDRLAGSASPRVIAVLRNSQTGETRAVYEAIDDPAFHHALLDAIRGRKKIRGAIGEIRAKSDGMLRRKTSPPQPNVPTTVVKSEQSNSSIAFGDQFILKLFRRLEPGVNPDLEIGRFLTERANFANAAPVAGSLEYFPRSGEPRTLAVLQTFVANESDGWRYAVGHVQQFLERVAAAPQDLEVHESWAIAESPLTLAAQTPPEPVAQLIGPFLQSADLIGARTAQMHRALASERSDPAFAPEPFSLMYQRSLYQSMRTYTRRTLATLQRHAESREGQFAHDARIVSQSEAALLEAFEPLVRRRINATRIRVHGDYHLGQILYTGKDFVIIDFEGEPMRALSERRLKRSPLRDAAGMLRSFSYASRAVLLENLERGVILNDPESYPRFETWAGIWSAWTSAAFLRSYLREAQDGGFVPPDPEDLQVLLRAYITEKLMFELNYEMNSRPKWVAIPLRDLLRLVQPTALAADSSEQDLHSSTAT